MYFFLCWSFGLEYLPSGRSFQASESIREGRELCVHTFVWAFRLSPLRAVTLGREDFIAHCIGHSCWSDQPWPLQPFFQNCFSLLLCTNTPSMAFPLEAESPRAEHPEGKSKELFLLATSLQQMDKSSPDQQHGPAMQDGACLPPHSPDSFARRMNSLPSSSCRGNQTLRSHLLDELSQCSHRSLDHFYPW